jgi:hypothetical protein
MNKTFNTYTLLAPSTFSAFSLRDSVTRWIIFKGLNIFFQYLLCLRCRENAQELTGSQAASDMILQNHRRLPVNFFRVKIAALGYLKRFTGRIFKIGQ